MAELHLLETAVACGTTILPFFNISATLLKKSPELHGSVMISKVVPPLPIKYTEEADAVGSGNVLRNTFLFTFCVIAHLELGGSEAVSADAPL